jgi:hypothetical protein
VSAGDWAALFIGLAAVMVFLRLTGTDRYHGQESPRLGKTVPAGTVDDRHGRDDGRNPA